MLAKYGDLLSPPNFEGGGQEEVYSFAREAVHKSLKAGLFLCGGNDENVSFFCFSISFLHFMLRLKGKCKNLAHPAIPAIFHECTPIRIALQLSIAKILNIQSLIMSLC